MIQRQKFDRQFFRDLWRLLKPYWTSEEKWIALGLIFLIIACIVIQVRASVGINEFFKDFFDAVQNFNIAVLIRSSIHFVVLFAIVILAFGYTLYFSGQLTIRWRRWLTKHYVADWLGDHSFYTLQVFHKTVDNPDQRISEDLNSFASSTISLFSTLLNSILTLIAFGIILWNLSGTLKINIGTLHLHIPGYMFFVTIIYAAVGTCLTFFIGKRLPGLNYNQQHVNADFRFGLVRVREASEQIALYRGEKVEEHRLKNLFTRIFDNYIHIIKVQRNLTFFMNGYNIFSALIGYVIGLPLFFAKKIQMGGVIQISVAFAQVLGALSMIVNSFSDIADWRAVIYRLTEFSSRIEEAKNTAIAMPIAMQQHEQENLMAKDLDLHLPNGVVLTQNFQCDFNPGDSVLITGSQGVGKSTLVKALAGIWPYGKGQIFTPKNKIFMFLPQKPYLPLGALRDVLAYPEYAQKFSDDEYAIVLAQCQLQKIQYELDTSRNWGQELSLGEQQLVAFARVFLHKPDWLFLDEATSALDEKTEVKMYQLLRQQFPILSIISVGHRSSLQAFHAIKIEISEL